MEVIGLYKWSQLVYDAGNVPPLREFPPFVLPDSSIVARTLVTGVNALITERIIDRGYPGIVISCPDHGREAAAFCLSEAVHAAAKLERSMAFDPNSWKPGDYFSYEENFFLFQGIDEDPDIGRAISYRYAKGPVKQAIDKLPRIRKRQIGDDEVKLSRKSLSHLVHETESSPTTPQSSGLIDNLKDSFGLAEESICFCSGTSNTSVVVAPTSLLKTKFYISGRQYQLDEYLLMGYLSADSAGEPKRRGPGKTKETPSLCSFGRTDSGGCDIQSVCQYVDAGYPSRCVVVDISDPKQLDLFDIEALIDHKVPVLVFCDDLVSDSLLDLREKGFLSFDWGKDRLHSLLKTDGVKKNYLSVTQRKLVEGGLSLLVDDEKGMASKTLSNVARILQQLQNSDAFAAGEEQQSSLRDLLQMLSKALRLTEPLSPTNSGALKQRVHEDCHVLTRSFQLSRVQVDEVNEVEKALCWAFDTSTRLPKQGKATNIILQRLRDGRSVSLIKGDRLGCESAEAFWDRLLEDRGLGNLKDDFSVLTPWQALKEEPNSQEEDVVISGWFNWKTMRRLLYSGPGSYYYLCLYKGSPEVDCELENDWYLRAREYWGKLEKELGRRSDDALKKAGIEAPAIRVSEPPARHSAKQGFDTESSFDTSIDAAVELIERAWASSEEARDGETSCMARPVYFTNGQRCWLRVGGEEEGDRLYVVTDVVNGTSPKSYKKTADVLTAGDMVLRTETDGDAISAQGASHQEQFLKDVSLWRKPIDDNISLMSKDEMVRRIMRAGCTKGEMAIRSWIAGKTRIAPMDSDDWVAIGKAFGVSYTAQEIARMERAVRVARGDRISTGREITRLIVNCFIEDCRSLGASGAVHGFNSRHGLGRIDVLTVSWVGPVTLVPVTLCRVYSK